VKAEARKTLILNCAKSLFSENGYHATQISDIISKARIARGTIYQYFKNKDDIFLSLLENYFKEWQMMINSRTDQIDMKGITAVEFFRFRLKSTLNFFAGDYELCNIVLRLGLGLNDDLARVNKEFELDIKSVITKDLELGRITKNLRKNVNIELTANILAGAILRVSHYYFVNEREKMMAIGIDKITDEIVDVFAPGLFTER
jgi:AcrR family transcriptional regulator